MGHRAERIALRAQGTGRKARKARKAEGVLSVVTDAKRMALRAQGARPKAKYFEIRTLCSMLYALCDKSNVGWASPTE